MNIAHFDRLAASFASLILVLGLPGPSQAEPKKAAGNSPRTFLQAKTWFQTNVGYDPRIAIATDGVVVHRHGASQETMTKTIGSWKAQGFLVGRMFFSDSDGNNAYWKGKWDGKPHEDEVERGPDGKVIQCGGERPYMLPTEGWSRYLEEQAEQYGDVYVCVYFLVQFHMLVSYKNHKNYRLSGVLHPEIQILGVVGVGTRRHPHHPQNLGHFHGSSKDPSNYPIMRILRRVFFSRKTAILAFLSYHRVCGNWAGGSAARARVRLHPGF